MSKSKGNIISPDEYANDNGSDIFRLNLIFGFAYSYYFVSLKSKIVCNPPAIYRGIASQKAI